MELLQIILLSGCLVVIECCQPWEFECQSSGTCLKATSRCNNKVECTDGSDELRCLQDTPRWTESPCLEGQFQCDNKHCVYKNWVCDHEDDCGDNSDENDCLHDSKSGVLGVGAVVGISLACSGVLLLFLSTLAYMLYHRVKAVHGLSRRDPVQEITDIMGSVPYHMPREALLRLPPPQYTLRTDLRNVQENRGFVVDEVLPTVSRPPPLYTSQPDLAFALNQSHASDLPPAYSSRQNLNEAEQSLQEVPRSHGMSHTHQVSPPLHVYHHRQHSQSVTTQHPNSQSLHRSRSAHQNSNNPTLVTQFQQRRFRGRISRVRESLPVLNRLASFARRSLSRPRRLRRHSRGTRQNNSSNAMVEHFYCEKPRALRRQQEHGTTRRTRPSTTQNAVQVNANGVESTFSNEARDTPPSSQSSPVKVPDLQVQQSEVDTESLCNTTDIKVHDSKLEIRNTEQAFPSTLSTKCRSVPELTLLHQSNHVTSEVKFDNRSGNPIGGQKSYSLTHLFDTNLKPLSVTKSESQSYLSVESWNC